MKSRLAIRNEEFVYGRCKGIDRCIFLKVAGLS